MRNQPSGSTAGVWVRFVLGMAIVATSLVLAWILQAERGWSWAWLLPPLALVGSGRLLLLPLLGSGDLGEPNSRRDGTVQRLRRPDGTVLQVECYGPADAPALILTHGWPVDSTEWYYARQELAGPFRVVVWDLPGVGKSSKPASRDYSMEKMAGDLEAVLQASGPGPAVLVGHSLGGMIVQMFCRLYPHHLGHRVAGIVLAHSTYTDPLATTSGAWLWRTLEKPVMVPWFHFLVALWPLAWLISWLNYLSGWGHILVRASNFAGGQTRGQVDYFAWVCASVSPAVIGRGALASLAYEGHEQLSDITIPALVITAREDRVARCDAAEEMQRRLPQAELVWLSHAGHMGPWEQHEAFARAVADFARRQLGMLPNRPSRTEERSVQPSSAPT